MCGIVAFAGLNPNPALLDQLAVLAERRGPDGSGWAVYDAAAGWTVTRDHAAPLTRVERPDVAGARLVIGHSRLATDGGVDLESRCQPYHDEHGVVVAYNGSLPGVWPDGDTAEIMARVLEAGPQIGLLRFLALAEMRSADRQAVIVGAGLPGVLGAQLWVAQRVGFYGPMPLWSMQLDEGLYLCSRKFDGAEKLEVGDGVRCLAAVRFGEHDTHLVVASGATATEEITT